MPIITVFITDVARVVLDRSISETKSEDGTQDVQTVTYNYEFLENFGVDSKNE